MKLRFFSIILSLGILALLVYLSDWQDVIRRVNQARLEYILYGLVLSVFIMILKTYRWDMLLKKVDIKTRLHRVFYILMAGIYISNLTPGRVGEPLRSYLLKRKEGVSFSRSVSSVLIERIQDTLALIVLALGGVLILYNAMPYKKLIAGMVLVYMVIITAFFMICSRTSRIHKFTRLFYRLFGWIPKLKKHKKDIENKILTFHKSLNIYKDPGVLAPTLFISLIIWATEGAILKITFTALGVEADLVGMMGILSISLLIAILTSLPGGLGSQEAVMVILINSCYGYPLGLTTSAVLIYRAISFWFNMIVGGLCFSMKS